MAKELAAKATEAFVDDDFDVAVDLYSKAIDLDPNCAELLADRAQANLKLQNFTEEEEKDLVQPAAKSDLTHVVPPALAKPKFRHEYYQKPEEVVVAIFAKGIQKQSVNIDFGEQIVSNTTTLY
ncbi:Protein SGT1-like protein A [Raphanus sativus]|nr:Protein SGT1-like protein A [Raphanus sativus]